MGVGGGTQTGRGDDSSPRPVPGAGMRSGVGPAAVVGRVTLARATLAGALAHGSLRQSWVWRTAAPDRRPLSHRDRHIADPRPTVRCILGQTEDSGRLGPSRFSQETVWRSESQNLPGIMVLRGAPVHGASCRIPNQTSSTATPSLRPRAEGDQAMATTPTIDTTFAPEGVGPRTQGWGWGG